MLIEERKAVVIEGDRGSFYLSRDTHSSFTYLTCVIRRIYDAPDYYRKVAISID